MQPMWYNRLGLNQNSSVAICLFSM